MQYPLDHAVANARVLRVIKIIAEDPQIEESELIRQLSEEGVHPVDAELLSVFVPCALTFRVLREKGVKQLPSSYQVRYRAKRWKSLPLYTEHYYTAALLIADEIFQNGYTDALSRDTYLAIANRSAEMNCISKMFDQGHAWEDIVDSAFSPITFVALSYEEILASRGLDVSLLGGSFGNKEIFDKLTQWPKPRRRRSPTTL